MTDIIYVEIFGIITILLIIVLYFLYIIREPKPYKGTEVAP